MRRGGLTKGEDGERQVKEGKMNDPFRWEDGFRSFELVEIRKETRGRVSN